MHALRCATRQHQTPGRERRRLAILAATRGQQADLTATEVRGGRPAGLITPHIAGIDLVQVVAPDHHVIAASSAARGLPPMTTVWPSADSPEQDVQACAQPRFGCVRLSALRVTAARDSPVVYAVRPAPGKISPGRFDAIFATDDRRALPLLRAGGRR